MGLETSGERGPWPPTPPADPAEDLVRAFRMINNQPYLVEPPPTLTARSRRALDADPQLQPVRDAFRARAEGSGEVCNAAGEGGRTELGRL